MHVAVVIVGFRNAGDVARAVGHILAQSYQNLSITICENGGVEATQALAAALSPMMGGIRQVSILSAPDNPGYAGGVNRAIAASAEADAWWILNPDTLPEPVALDALSQRLSRGDVAAVGGVLHDGHGFVQSLGGRWRGALARAESLGRGRMVDTPVEIGAVEREIDYLSGASMLVGRAMMDMIGPMREDYFLYAEEVEWCLRAKAAGLRFGFAPLAKVVHHQGGATGSGESARQRPRLPIWLDERNKLNVVRDTQPWALLTAIPASLILLSLRYGKAMAWRQWRFALGGWWAGVRNQRGKPPWVQ
jgi:GT2 family glycosyltransferase